MSHRHKVDASLFPENGRVPLRPSGDHHAGSPGLLPELLNALVGVHLTVSIIAGSAVGNDGQGTVLK